MIGQQGGHSAPTIIYDPAACRALAQDYGGYMQRMPKGLIRPTTVAEVVAAVQYAREQRIQLAVRGAGHSTHGQAQVADGLVLDLRGLDCVLELTTDSIWVEAGILWRAVAQRALTVGRTFPVFTDYLATTVGGTLAVGGVGSRTWQLGAQTDHVLELEVVTVHGDIVRCSPERHADLFDAVRAGLGQFGIITKARLRLTAAPQRAHYHRALYSDFDMFWRTLHAQVDEAAYECIQGFALGNSPQALAGHIGPAAADFTAPADAGLWLYCIETVKFLNQDAELATTAPQDHAWLPGGYFALDLPYLAYIDRLGPVEEQLRQLGLWQLPHPMLDLLLPAAPAQPFLGELLASLDPGEVAGPVLVYPYERKPLRTPFLRVPAAGRVVLVGLMRTTLPPTPEHVQAQITDNRRLYERAVACGGCYYPVDSVPMTQRDWQQHFGEQWRQFVDAKARFDPLHLLNPGQTIFGEAPHAHPGGAAQGQSELR
jgi:FAD/FMN-containing dehydrogenase